MSNYQLKPKNKGNHIPLRLNLLFILTFLSFIALFVRLGYLQLYNGEYFRNMVERTESTLSSGSVPRGMIYDAQGNVLVGNKAEQAFFYTRDRASRVSNNDIIKTATQLASLIDMPTSDLTERDRKDYFISKNEADVNQRLNQEEKQLKGSDLYEAQLNYVKPEEIQFSDAELKIVALFKQMSGAYEYSTVPIKNQNVTQEEVARVSEHLGNLPGVSIGTDWQRTYPQGNMLRSILGEVSNEKRGLPLETAQALINRGYAMNDRVGISYLEKQYEDALRGTKSLHNVVTDNKDDIVNSQVIYDGTNGDNLMLTINSEFQKRLDEIAENSLKRIDDQGGMNDRVYITAIDPRNGDVLGIAGKRFDYNEATDSYNKDKIVDDALGAINSSYGMGSSIKPAMISTGYMEGVISTDNNTIVDEPMKFAASQEKSSVFNRNGKVPINDIEALQKSSNVYMIKLAMLIGHQTSHEPDGPLTIDPNTINIIRGHLSEFGLGVKTGIDLPNESIGYSPVSDQLVNAIDLSYGQFDLYTPLQLAQYAATIANGGIRYAPRLVKDIRGTDANGHLGGVKTTINSKILNVVPVTSEQMQRIHEGMRQVSHTTDGTAHYLFMNYPIVVGSKTGTTEAFYAGPIQYANNKPCTNATFIGYAPFDKPEIAISVVVPYLEESATGRESTVVAHEVMNAYFESKAETRDVIKKYMGSSQAPNY